MPRIISGTHRRHELLAPPDALTSRPWPDRVKESVCNVLRGWFEDAVALDLFAGVGTMGLELISRGARQVTMVERDRRVLDILRRNVQRLDAEDRAVIVASDALAAPTLGRVAGPLDLVFIDPPYAMMREDTGRERVLAQAARCARIMKPASFLVLRTPLDPARTPHVVDGFVGPEVHDHGREMFVMLYQPQGADRGGAADAPDAVGRAGDDDG